MSQPLMDPDHYLINMRSVLL